MDRKWAVQRSWCQEQNLESDDDEYEGARMTGQLWESVTWCFLPLPQEESVSDCWSPPHPRRSPPALAPMSNTARAPCRVGKQHFHVHSDVEHESAAKNDFLRNTLHSRGWRQAKPRRAAPCFVLFWSADRSLCRGVGALSSTAGRAKIKNLQGCGQLMHRSFVD